MNNSEKLQSEIQKKLAQHELFETFKYFEQDLGRRYQDSGVCLSFRLQRLDRSPSFIAFWFESKVDQLPLKGSSVSIYYSTLDSERDLILESFLYFLKRLGMNRFIDLEFREWEYFLRLKNSEPIVAHEEKKSLEFLFEHLKSEIMGHLLKRMFELSQMSLFEDFKVLQSYEEGNKKFFSLGKVINQTLNHPDLLFEAIEYKEGVYYFKMISLSKNTLLSAYFESIMVKNYSFGTIFPLKLVAQE